MKRTLNHIKETLSGLYDQAEIDSFCMIILNDLFGISRNDMIINRDITISDADFAKVKEITLRISRYEPIQYVLGKTEFYGLPFFVEPGVLIPRFETEELVDLIIKENNHREKLKVLDLGTGSGCIGISIKKSLPFAEVWCCDISDKALEVSCRNAKLNAVRVTVEKYDILGNSMFKEDGFDVLVSNPPYVTNAEKKFMSKNVLDYEPGLALFVPDEDPLLFYRSIVAKSKHLLKPGGLLYFEINEAFGALTSQLLSENGYKTEIIKDINGKDRIVKGIKD